MTAREKIQNLTNAWYGYFLFAGIATVVQNGFGLISIFLTGLFTLGLFFVTWVIGRRLLAKSSLMRFLLLAVSTLTALASGYGTVKAGLAFLHDWSFSMLVGIVLGAGSVAMHVRSLRVLTDSSVKSYIDS